MARLSKRQVVKPVLDMEAMVALVDRHLDEYEWLLERTKVEGKISDLEEQLAHLRRLNPDGLDVPNLLVEHRRLIEQIEQIRFALAADYGARGATGSALWGDEPDAA